MSILGTICYYLHLTDREAEAQESKSPSLSHREIGQRQNSQPAISSRLQPHYTYHLA